MGRLILAAWTVLLATLTACVNMDDEDRNKASFTSAEGGTGTSWRTKGVNSPINVGPGEKTGDVSTVNGSIHIGDNAEVAKASTVNGGITIGDGAVASSLNTVNGSISMEEGSKVTGNVSTVNGPITLEEGSEVSGKVSNVNGVIRLKGARVGGGIQTTSGNIDIGKDSHVEGGILIRRMSGSFFFGFGDDRHVPRVVIGPGATVEGTLKFERKVELYVSDSAQIGPVEGATPIRFSGDRPRG